MFCFPSTFWSLWIPYLIIVASLYLGTVNLCYGQHDCIRIKRKHTWSWFAAVELIGFVQNSNWIVTPACMILSSVPNCATKFLRKPICGYLFLRSCGERVLCGRLCGEHGGEQRSSVAGHRHDCQSIPVGGSSFHGTAGGPGTSRGRHCFGIRSGQQLFHVTSSIPWHLFPILEGSRYVTGSLIFFM